MTELIYGLPLALSGIISLILIYSSKEMGGGVPGNSSILMFFGLQIAIGIITLYLYWRKKMRMRLNFKKIQHFSLKETVGYTMLLVTISIIMEIPMIVIAEATNTLEVSNDMIAFATWYPTAKLIIGLFISFFAGGLIKIVIDTKPDLFK